MSRGKPSTERIVSQLSASDTQARPVFSKQADATDAEIFYVFAYRQFILGTMASSTLFLHNVPEKNRLNMS